MKIGLLLPANIYFCPYVRIYSSILEQNNIEYDIIYWDKDGINENAAFRFDYPINKEINKFKKLLSYLKYSQFLKRIIRNNNYDKLIVFGPQIGIFLYTFLKKYYFKKFIFDYRDISIEQKFKKTFKKLLNVSFLNVISSPGFKMCLPNNFDYILSHNLEFSSINENLDYNNSPSSNDKIIILTIGAIRDYEQNIELINSLKNNTKYSLHFIGKGPSSNDIKDYVEKNNITNVKFKDFYHKEEEDYYYKRASFINIYYPRKLSHDTALSNRFYNALLYQKPIIATTNTIQGNYVDNYNLGISINDCSNLDNEIQNYITNLDHDRYREDINLLLNSFREDYVDFEAKILSFLHHN